MWQNSEHVSDELELEEKKRTWWAIVIMDRFLNLRNGDSLFVTDDPVRTDQLPIEDLMWSECVDREKLRYLISQAPFLDTPFDTVVGQLARESQISHLAGRVVRLVFDPIPDTRFNHEEAIQLERTLNAYTPLLSDEELRIGKYCAAFGMCNRYVMLLGLLRLDTQSYSLMEAVPCSFSTNGC
jgi:hypothetical protein